MKRSARSDVRHNGRHQVEPREIDVDDLSNRGVVHQVVDNVAESFRHGTDVIADKGRQVKEAADEQLAAHPYISMGAAFVAGMATCALLRWSMRRA